MHLAANFVNNSTLPLISPFPHNCNASLVVSMSHARSTTPTVPVHDKCFMHSLRQLLLD